MQAITHKDFLKLIDRSESVCFLQDDWRFLKQEFPKQYDFSEESFIAEIELEALDNVERDGFVGCFYLKNKHQILNSLDDNILFSPSISFYFSSSTPKALLKKFEHEILLSFFNYPETNDKLTRYLDGISSHLHDWIVLINETDE